jgi:hypothetical protein
MASENKEMRKSKFLPPITTRNGLDYPTPGQWMRNASFNQLATLAKNLDTSESKSNTDKLHSVPTPWARLLLFETALFERGHPAHNEVRDQWRGLLGLIGLANVLGLEQQLYVKPISLEAERAGELRDAFITLKPRHLVGGIDQESGKWDRFGLIFLNGTLIGATSPRTLVFTGIGHECPASVPFRSTDGRLVDPAKYYSHNDPTLLSALRQWIDALETSIRQDQQFFRWLGERPTDPNAQVEARGTKILKALEEWQGDIDITEGHIGIVMSDHSRLPGRYQIIRHVERAEIRRESDLFYRDRTNLIVLFRPDRNSRFVDSHDNEITGEPINLYSGHRINSGQSLPQHLDFLPPDITVISDPAGELFEESLIEIQLIDSKNVLSLSLEKKNYLLPFKKKLLELFSPSELATLIQRIRIKRIDASSIRVELNLPLVNGKAVKLHKDFIQNKNIITNDNTDHPTQYVAMWPDFVCLDKNDDDKPVFDQYFYYTNDSQQPGQTQVAFTPISTDIKKRQIMDKGRTWYLSDKPIPGFIGNVGGKEGLLLIKYTEIPRPSRHWRVGVDFGSTHTTVFYGEVELQGDGTWRAKPNSQITPLHIQPRVQILTQGESAQIQENFFVYRAAGTQALPHKEIALTTQLSMPLGFADYHKDDWLPREGQVFLGSVLDGAPTGLETDLKWNSDRNNHTISAFLRSLLMMVKAEAVRSGAEVAIVEHAYPTAFSDELELKHSEEWSAVERCVRVPVAQQPLSEAVAVCRHLWDAQQALPIANMIALDIGGSTTDIAVWSKGPLRLQESIKMAAGAASRYVESTAAIPFRQWLVKKLAEDEPFKSSRIVRASFSANDLKSRRTYNAVLKRITENGHMDNFINLIKVSARSSPEVRSFLSPIVLILAAVSYFAGLLTRKALGPIDEEFYVFFCGKGGQLLRWIPQGDDVMKEAFAAGVRGADLNRSLPSVSIKISSFPKEEVGRGLLIERPLQVNLPNALTGIFSEAAATVTVGETGYGELAWNAGLGFEELERARDLMPQIKSLAELNNFVDTLTQSSLTRELAASYDLAHLILKPLYRNTLIQRLSDNLVGGKDRALIEPLFITEVKALAEVITGQRELFD